jgi:invasion protein IalB
MTSERFSDWVLLCPKPKEAPAGAICFMTQEIVNPKTNQGLAAIAVAKPAGRPDPMIGFNLPPQIDPNKPIGLQVDQGKGSSLKVERCDAQKCSTETRLPKEILDQFLKGKEALVLFAMPNQEKPFGVKFSLKGFGAAFKALDRKRG